MVDISQGDRDFITRYPLYDWLSHLRQPLEEVERTYDPPLGPQDEPAELSWLNGQKTISRLLNAFAGHEVAFNIDSKGGSANVASDLFTLSQRIRKDDDLTYDYFRPLVKLVIERKPDIEIWKAVFDLIATLSCITPPATVPPGLDETPITHTSASQQGAEQTKDLLEKRLFEEIKNCTYRSAEGFVKKHFEEKHWTDRVLDIFKRIKHRHQNGRWTDFPNPPKQDDVVNWWLKFQEEFLSEEQHRYYKTSSPKELTGAEARRQLDLFVKRNEGPSDNIVHDLKDVKMIGELKESNRDKKPTLLQITRYVRDIFSCQPTRRYVPAFTLCGSKMEVWIFDRSGPYGPGAFDIHEEPERFILVVAGYLMMDDEEFGLDTFIRQDSAGCSITVNTPDQKPITLRIEPTAFVYQRAIVCRGTSCFLAKTPDSKHHDCVAKFSWTSDRRRPEADLLKVAGERGVTGIAKLVGFQEIASISRMRSGLAFGKQYCFQGLNGTTSFSQSFPPSQQSQQSQSQPQSFKPGSFSELHGLSLAQSPSRKRQSVDVGRRLSKRSRSNSQRSGQQSEVKYDVEEAQGTSLVDSNNSLYDHRTFRCLVISPAGRPIRKHESLLELVTALRDAIKAHRSLYITGNILHRDISENNIIITDPTRDGFQGMLIDLDLAKELESGPSGARCRTGTMEFMAIEVLKGKSNTYRHDLESFFYVLLWICGRRGWDFVGRPKDRPTKTRFEKWYTDSYEDIADAKRGHMQIEGIEDIMAEFPQPEFDFARHLCREVRRILFPPREGGLFLGTPKDPEILYNPIMSAFDKAINDIKGGRG